MQQVEKKPWPPPVLNFNAMEEGFTAGSFMFQADVDDIHKCILQGLVEKLYKLGDQFDVAPGNWLVFLLAMTGGPSLTWGDILGWNSGVHAIPVKVKYV